MLCISFGPAACTHTRTQKKMLAQSVSVDGCPELVRYNALLLKQRVSGVVKKREPFDSARVGKRRFRFWFANGKLTSSLVREGVNPASARVEPAECKWYDDSVFDEVNEQFDGITLRGDEWRRLMSITDGNTRDFSVISVAGATFCKSAIASLTDCGAIFGFAKLVPEPENRYDSRAIKVMVGDKHVGYVPRKKNDSKLYTKNPRVHVLKFGTTPPHVWLVVEMNESLC